MSDKEYRDQKKRILRFAEPLKDLLLSDFTIAYEFHRSLNQDGESIMAETRSLWHYRKGHIDFFMPAIQELAQDDSTLFEIILHEFVHHLIDPLQRLDSESDTKITELVCTTLTSNMIRLFESKDLYK